MVKAAVNSLAANHPLRAYMSIAPDLAFDAGMVDTFLHGRDRSYTVDDCLELVSSAGLVFGDWFLKTSYYPSTLTEPDNEFYASVNTLPDRAKWSIMERVKTLNACHFFTACRPERPEASYRVDFSAGNAAEYIPLMRLKCGLRGQEIYRPGWSLRLDPSHLAFVQFVDGERTIRQIAERVAQSGVLARAEQSELELIGLELFEGLWRNDFIAVDLSATR